MSVGDCLLSPTSRQNDGRQGKWHGKGRLTQEGCRHTVLMRYCTSMSEVKSRWEASYLGRDEYGLVWAPVRGPSAIGDLDN